MGQRDFVSNKCLSDFERYRLTMAEDNNLVMSPNFDEVYANSEEVIERERVNISRLCKVLAES